MFGDILYSSMYMCLLYSGYYRYCDLHLCFVSFSVPPTITFSPSAVRDVVSGETLTASCDASADPAPVIQWFKGDRQLNDRDPNGVSISQQTEDTTANSQITVMSFTSEDAGVYSCVAINDLGNDSRSFQVNTVGESAVLILLIQFITYVVHS